MALTRSSRAVAAREKARNLAKAAQERESVLLSLAEQYFVLDGEADALRDEAADKGAKLVKAAKAKAAELVAAAETEAKAKLERTTDVVVRMLATGASRADVAARLDLSVSTVRKIDIDQPKPVNPAPDEGASAVSGQVQVSPEHDVDQEHGHVAEHEDQEHSFLREPVPVG